MDLVAIKCLLVGSFKTFVEKVKRITILDISSFNWDIYTVIFTFYFTLGTLLGGAAGMSIWHESSWWCGYIRGAVLGAISGIISTIVVVDDIAMSFRDGENIFDVGGVEGLSEDSVAKILKITVTSDNYVDTSGERVSCSVCLQDFEVGETAVRSLPHCHHMFHIPCIDMWLIRHGSCPYCRRAL